MSKYEIISSLVSLLAIVISSVSLIRTRKLAKEQLELERVTAELSKLQIESIELEKADKIKPKFNVSLTKLGKSYSFYISNTGQGSAFDVDFELVNCDNSPLCSDVDEKFPHPEMKPNTRVNLLASICMGSPLKYQTKVTWKDLDKVSHEELFWVTV